MDFSGERVVLGKTPLRVEAEHKARYRYVVPLVKDQKVLDIACGSGYGTAMLGESAKEVHGVDISEEAVEHAAATYGKEHIKFSCGNAAKINFPDNYFDSIVSYETIEHLETQDSVNYMKELFRVLKPGGNYFLSTPNKRVVSPNSDVSLVSDYHTHEYVEDELVAYVKKFGFKVEKVLGQRIVPKWAVHWQIRALFDAIGKYILRRRVDLYWIPTGPSVVEYDSRHEPRYFVLIATK